MRRTLLALVVCALTACGGVSSGPRDATPSISAPAQRTIEAPTAIPAMPTSRPPHATPTVYGVTCGTVEVRDNRVINPADAQAAEECFWQAYQQCAVDRNAVIAVRESTDETPYVDSMYGPASIRFNTVRSFAVIAGDDGGCALRASLGSGPLRRTQTGTSIPGPGTQAYPFFTCAGVTRSADGGLHVIGCKGPEKTYDLPRA